MISYRTLKEEEISRELFRHFIRRQVVGKCLRREGDKWIEKDDPFIDDWSEEDYKTLICCLKNTVKTGGFVYGAFEDGMLKGFVSVESKRFGGVAHSIWISPRSISPRTGEEGGSEKRCF